MAERGKNPINPDGLMSFLTKFGRKSSATKSGSDNYCHPRLLKPLEKTSNTRRKSGQNLNLFIYIYIV